MPHYMRRVSNINSKSSDYKIKRTFFLVSSDLHIRSIFSSKSQVITLLRVKGIVIRYPVHFWFRDSFIFDPFKNTKFKNFKPVFDHRSIKRMMRYLG